MRSQEGKTPSGDATERTIASLVMWTSRTIRGAFERVVLKRLERVGSDLTSERIVQAALRLAGVREVPEEPVGFGLFVTGALYDVVHASLGGDVAEAVIADLSVFFSVGEDASVSGLRRRCREDRCSARVVLIASTDSARIATIEAALKEQCKEECEVRTAPDVFALLQLTETLLDRSLTLVMDGTLPGLRDPMLMTFSRVLPPTTRLILWGHTPAAPEFSVDGAVQLPVEAPAAEVVAHCMRPLEAEADWCSS